MSANGHRRTQRAPGGQPGPPPPRPQPQVPPLAVLQQQHEVLVERNRAAFTELESRGIRLDPLALLHSRIDFLIHSVAMFAGPDGPQWEALTKFQFENHVAEQLQEAKAEGTKALLAQGSSFSPSMIRALADQADVFGDRARRGG